MYIYVHTKNTKYKFLEDASERNSHIYVQAKGSVRRDKCILLDGELF
jgi:hypothetical protein